MRTERVRLIVQDGDTPHLRPHIHLRFDPKRQAFALLAPEHVYWPDEISVAILQKMDGDQTVAKIISELANEYGAAEQEVGPDVLEFLQTWADERLIESGRR